MIEITIFVPDFVIHSIMIRHIKNWTFITIAFLLGSIATIYIDFFNAIVLVGILFNFFSDRKKFIENIKDGYWFLKIPLLFLVYIALHTLYLKLFGTGTVKYDYTIFESLLLYFIAIPLYICSVKDILDKTQLKRCLLAFVGGVVVFNIAAFFKLTGATLFNDPVSAISQLAASRFGGNKEIFGSFIFLEPQTLYINIATMIVFYFGIITKNIYQKAGYIVFFLLLLFFLILTETKSAFLSFAIGFIVLAIFLLKGKSLKYKSGFAGIIVSVMVIFLVFAPASLKERLQLAKTELNNALNDNLAGGGTIMPRVALYKVNFSHFKEFGITGLGVTYTKTVAQWYDDSEYAIASLTDPHNSFMYYWLMGGIPGLLFVLGLFILPIWKMFKDRQFSYVILSLWLIILIANNTTVLLALNDSKPLIIFFLSLFFWGNDAFRKWDEEKTSSLKNC